MRKILLALCFFALSGMANSQIYFTKTYGNASANYGLGYIQYVPEHKSVFGCGRDGSLLRFDVYGNLEWAVNTGGQYHLNFAVAKNGDLMLCGLVNIGGIYQLSICRADALGNVLYAKAYVSDRLLDAKIIRCDSLTDTYIIKCWYDAVGFNDDIMLIKIKGSGKIIWQYRYADGIADEQTGGIVPDGLGGAFISGLSIQDGGKCFWAHVDANGNMGEIKYYGNQFAPADNMIRLSDGGFLITGIYYNGATFSRDPFAMKLDNNGDFVWFKAYQNATINIAFGYSGNCSAAEGKEGDVYISGLTGDGGSLRLRVIKINPDGEIFWIKDGESSASTSYYQTAITHIPKEAHEIFWLSDSKNYGDVGFGLNDLVITAEDADFSGCLWTDITPVTYSVSFNALNSSTQRYPLSLQPHSVPAAIPTFYNSTDICAQEMTAREGTEHINMNISYLSDSLQYVQQLKNYYSGNDKQVGIKIYPQPASDKISLSGELSNTKIEICDLTGTVLLQLPFEQINSQTIDVSFLTSGMYILYSKNSNGVVLNTSKIIILK